MLNKDFCKYLPIQFRIELDMIIKDYSDSPWFNTAWNEYRNYVMLARGTLGLRSPGYIFNKYVA